MNSSFSVVTPSYNQGQLRVTIKSVLSQGIPDIIDWFSSDDIHHPQTLRRILELFEQHSEIDVIYGRAHHTDEQGAIFEEYPTEEWSFEVLIHHRIISRLGRFAAQSDKKIWLIGDSSEHCVDYEFWTGLREKVPDFFLYLIFSSQDHFTLKPRHGLHGSNATSKRTTSWWNT